MKKIFLQAATLLASVATASALSIVPADADYSGFKAGNLLKSEVETEVGAVANSLTLVYKKNAPDNGAEEGSLTAFYDTDFFNSESEPEAATISWVLGSPTWISGAKIYLYVKDGTPRPWYIFDISSWNGTETLNLSSFYTGPGSISNVAIYASGRRSVSVPDSGATLMLFGVAFGGIVGVRRSLAI